MASRRNRGGSQNPTREEQISFAPSLSNSVPAADHEKDEKSKLEPIGTPSASASQERKYINGDLSKPWSAYFTSPNKADGEQGRPEEKENSSRAEGDCERSSEMSNGRYPKPWPAYFIHPSPKDLPAKTPVSILQEVLSRKGLTPTYELLQEEGAIHEPTFRYRVTVLPDLIATGTGRSKKEAKHSAAKAILEKLKGCNELLYPFPDYFNNVEVNHSTEKSTCSISNEDGCDNPIGVLQELCMSKRWPPPTYHTEKEEGLPHERQFTIACSVFRFKETGTGKSKKVAKRLAAHKMLIYLRGIPSEENNGTSLGLDDDDELAQHLSLGNMEHGDLKSFRASMFSQNLKVSQFHKNLKSSQGPKLSELQSTYLSCSDLDPVKLLQELGEEQAFIVTYVDIEEISFSGKHQCLVQLSTPPVTVCFGEGDSAEAAHVNAALTTLKFLKLMTQKNDSNKQVAVKKSPS